MPPHSDRRGGVPVNPCVPPLGGEGAERAKCNQHIVCPCSYRDGDIGRGMHLICFS